MEFLGSIFVFYTGKKKCCLRPEKILKLLAELLGYENHEVVF